MDWPLAIDRNRAVLFAVVSAILALIGENGPVSRSVRSAALALLRPAESAVRRLVVIAARGLVVTLRDRLPPAFDRLAARAAGRERTPAFPLFDRRKHFGQLLRAVELPRGTPRIRTFWGPPAAPVVCAVPAAKERPSPAALVEVARLRLRLASLERALSDVPRQARRLARWRARRAASPDRHVPSPLRIGHPPGHRRQASREIDHVLRDCHALARQALAFDSS
jgi:hypothetical protein